MNKDTYNTERRYLKYKINEILNGNKTCKEILAKEKREELKKDNKFLFNDSYYEKLVFVPEKIEDIQNINVELEFIKPKTNTKTNKKQRDLWKYFMIHTSSLSYQKPCFRTSCKR